MQMPEADKGKVLARLKSIEGHVRGIQRMVEEDQYCIDIIRQSQAVQRALDRFNALILENHLNTCVTTAIRGEDVDERERVVAEIMNVFETAGKL
ncbi:MAG: metal-sensitive transcriptional regulator [Anaerolineae bacterium]